MDTPTLQHSNTPIFQHPNTPTPQHPNTPMFLRPHISTLPMPLGKFTYIAKYAFYLILELANDFNFATYKISNEH